jgi:hypothetical protein
LNVTSGNTFAILSGKPNRPLNGTGWRMQFRKPNFYGLRPSMEALTVEQFKKCQRLLKAAMGREVRVRIGRRTLFRGFIVKG